MCWYVICVCVSRVLLCSWFLSFTAFVDDLTLLGLASSRTCSLLQIFFFSSLSVYRCPCACNSIPPLLYLFIPASVCISTVQRVSATIMSYPVRSARSLFFFLLASPSFNTFLSFSFNVSICAGAPHTPVAAFSNAPHHPPLQPTQPFSLILSLCLSIFPFSPSLTLCCLNKVAFIRMSRNPNKPNKRYGRENLPAEEGGSYRASLCVPACQLAMPPTDDPSLYTHTHTPNSGISPPPSSLGLTHGILHRAGT